MQGLQEQWNWKRKFYEQYYKQEDCDLFMEVMPFVYTAATRIIQFKLEFSSYCMETKQFDFQVNLGDYRHANIDMHPNVVNLYIWDNFYQLKFTKHEIINQNDVMFSSKYDIVNVTGLYTGEAMLDLRSKSLIHMDPQSRNSFNQYNISKLKNMPMNQNCKLKIFKSGNYKNEEEFKSRQKKPILVVRADIDEIV